MGIHMDAISFAPVVFSHFTTCTPPYIIYIVPTPRAYRLNNLGLLVIIIITNELNFYGKNFFLKHAKPYGQNQ